MARSTTDTTTTAILTSNPSSTVTPPSGSDPPDTPPANRTPSPTSALRALAQSHLHTIHLDLQAEAIAQETTMRDLQRYAKVRRRDRPKLNPNAAATPPSPSTGSPAHDNDDLQQKPKPKLRSAQDVLARLRHDPAFAVGADPGNAHAKSTYFIGYLERFEGMCEMELAKWVRESTDEEWIPMHRVRYVRRVWVECDAEGRRLERSEVLWDRDGRVDRIFGSGNTARQDVGEVEEGIGSGCGSVVEDEDGGVRVV